MAVNLSPIWGAGAQLLDNSGNVLSGGKIYTYAAGTTTQVTTYTSNTGVTANSNPIVLNSAGRVPYEIWLTDGQNYKFVLKDSNDVLIGTWDNLSGINSNFIAYTNQQEIQTATAGQTVFNLTTMQYLPGTGNLSVFVDGVNQYGPGAQYAFEETDQTTITFASGLHVGASVKFTSTQIENAGVADASQISYTYPDPDAVTQNVEERLAQYVSVKDFGAIGDGVTDDTYAIQNALAASKQVYFPDGTYIMTAPFITDGHTITGVVGETFSTTGSVVKFDMDATPAVPFAVRNINNKSVVTNIRFIQKDWSVPLNGLRIDRIADYVNCDFSYFNGYGVVFESVDASSRTCYLSSFRNVTIDYNAKSGIYLGGGANALLLENIRVRWNGAPSYDVEPTVVGLWDGIFSDGSALFPGNGYTGEPQEVVLINPEVAYNSRYGINLYRFFDGLISGGYGEGNLTADIAIVNVFGTVVSNYMSAQAPVINVPTTDPLEPSRSIYTYPNQITIRGYSYGFGQVSTSFSNVYKQRLNAMLSVGSDGTVELGQNSAGAINVTKTGGNTVNWNFGSVPVVSQTFAFGDRSYTPTQFNYFGRASDTEGSVYFNMLTGSQFGQFQVANGGGASTSATYQIAPKNSTTNRSINAGGTVNASGSDYAEYMTKAGNFVISKGDICGINAEGKLTDRFDDSVAFVVKSTNPSYVGGDTWATEELVGKKPEDDESFAEWYALVEEKRQLVDRIAFCGQVPVNITNATAGEYIVPVADDNGGIKGIAISNPTFEQYQIAVGKVISVDSNGKPTIIVKVA